MKVKRILLTGDDGYNSIGTRLLVRALKDKYELCIAGTKHQQSGVGGALSLQKGGTWSEEVVDGVPALCVDGTPADVMEVAQGYFAKPFDLILSGVNWGANASTTVVSSGTFSAALRGLAVQLAPRAITMSWDSPPSLWHKKHDAREDISSHFAYPGDVLGPVLEKILREKMWGVSLVNVNFPQKPSKKVRFTKFLKDSTRFYSYPIDIDKITHSFSFARHPLNIQETNLEYDVAAITQGCISITPCVVDMTDYPAFEKLKKQTFLLAEEK